VSYEEIAARVTRAGLRSGLWVDGSLRGTSGTSADRMAWRMANGLRIRVEIRSERDRTKLNQRCFVFQAYRDRPGDDH